MKYHFVFVRIIEDWGVWKLCFRGMEFCVPERKLFINEKEITYLSGRYLAENASARELRSHKKAFLLGSILPDIRPSFVTKKHEYNGTYEEVQESIRRLTTDCNLLLRNRRFTAAGWERLFTMWRITLHFPIIPAIREA